MHKFLLCSLLRNSTDDASWLHREVNVQWEIWPREGDQPVDRFLVEGAVEAGRVTHPVASSRFLPHSLLPSPLPPLFLPSSPLFSPYPSPTPPYTGPLSNPVAHSPVSPSFRKLEIFNICHMRDEKDIPGGGSIWQSHAFLS